MTANSASTAEDFVTLDVGTLRNWRIGRSGTTADTIKRFLAGSATDDDRTYLANWAATHGDAYPRTCEALARELERTK